MIALPDALQRTVEQCILQELQAMNLYTTLANRAEDATSIRMLRLLAELEESHVSRLVELLTLAREDSEEILSQVDIVQSFREEGWALHKARLSGAGLSDESPASAFLAFAIASEAQAATHYDWLASKSADQAARQLFQTLSREETSHERQLLRLQRVLRLDTAGPPEPVSRPSQHPWTRGA